MALGRENYGFPGFHETPTVVWVIMLFALVLLVVMAKVFAEVSVDVGIK